jgi:hypothetical protein
LVSFSAVAKRYPGGEEALKSVSFSIEAGELAFVTGEAGVVTGNLFATATLLILFLVSAILVVVTIVLPLRPAIRDVGRKLAFGGTAYFLLIGIGFMVTEIGLLQRTAQPWRGVLGPSDRCGGERERPRCYGGCLLHVPPRIVIR